MAGEERKIIKAAEFSDARKTFILKQGADCVPVAAICRRAGISQATDFNWKKKYDSLLPKEMKRLKQLELPIGNKPPIALMNPGDAASPSP